MKVDLLELQKRIEQDLLEIEADLKHKLELLKF